MNDKHEQQQTKTSANFRHLNTDTLRAENCLNDDVLPEEERRQLEIYAQQNWDKFYNINKSNFFKDRHWLTREFPQLLSGSESERKCLMEIGCGTGSTIYPLVKSNPFLFCHAFDFSKHAVTLVHTHKRYRPDRVNGFVWDISKAPIPLSMGVKPESVDLITSIFVLSALAPENLLPSAIRLNHVLKMGGQVLFRDYAAGDHAQLRFGTQHKLGDNYHKRSDGTLSKFFTEEELEGIFREAGFECSDMKRSEKLIENRASGVSMDRSWLQAVFTFASSCFILSERNGPFLFHKKSKKHS
ncbi:putative O-methyltransferase 3 [Blattamonas nauphoetae]|uniref:tRNA N(3)-methylcytidine methyltransferase n=1 Tax=Blattamonas nauphoetae TaxID=2049346 RepID=A0ABQ9YEW7_9EUKA|nr:putative O-methyltransferase 3 [Blattamonas nauphoetae]